VQLTDARHINSEQVEEESEFSPTFRKVTRSPFEEMAARLAAGNHMEAIPEALAALMLQAQRKETVTPKGITFDLQGVSHNFFHPECHTCHPSNIGKAFLISFDPDDLDVIYILSDDGRFQEAVPRANKVAWFDPEMDKEIQKYRSVTKHVHEGLRKTHARTTKIERNRTKANAEALQMSHTVTPPEPQADHLAAPPKQDADPAHDQDRSHPVPGRAASRGFSRAEEVKEAQEVILGQRTQFRDREKASRARIGAVRGQVDELLPDNNKDNVEQAEEDASLDDVSAML